MEKNTDEIDLMFFIDKLNSLFKKAVVTIFDCLQFVRRNWIVILILLAAGVGYGYYVNSQFSPSKQTRILTRINFDAVNNVYIIADNINSEIAQRTFGDNAELESKKQLKNVASVSLTPIINLKQILSKYDVNDRKLEGLIKSLEFEFDEEEGEFGSISETFRSEYNYHYMDVVLANDGTAETLDYLYDYINNTPLLKELNVVGRKNLEDRITGTQETIEQIDMVLEAYKANEADGSAPGPAAQLYVVDKNFNIAEVLKNKISLQQKLDDMKKDFVYSNNVVVNMNNPGVYVEEGILDNKMLVYPIMFVFMFFLLAVLKNAYVAMRRMAKEA